ncbi:DUF1090 domain-containing protein [Pseudomonas savastanoi]|uniref:Protein yqjC n=2 Tax=Pseudomonas savastanoi pv. glycinea TaxID=318 RepID=A0A0N8RKM1_PSESG|nr:DUF1090 domain-containing protein [Pseudomonas savastanoi]EFW82378.1 hypothetical protein PsgB076_01911 [Pseudomonas savastanoi pv. glycinea str. B076]EFW87620.1 hypothetical protein PsgRace4_01360 [Pseudomonas savastanoi pv. glycinea str. race 4]EGH06553.1 hypothetical protein Pgy4_02635 [Pseudomonas savastanoi pv. glycinea str. race 4]KPC20519.1 Uncharacterized protein AC498_1449 [Pseudomonas savastanoi pv. glycinea]KPC32250.1 Uncharacterized protein AC497_0091 [Pseudomonas savastanoi pv.
MQFLSPLILFTSCTLLATTLLADEQAPAPSECQIKSQEISSKIQDAKTEGNKAEQAGLEKALAEVNANCTETSLIKQRKQKVLDAKQEVSRRQTDLNKAMDKGDPEKINKRKDKLAESRKELQEAQTELEKVQPDD